MQVIYSENIFDLYPDAIVHPVNAIGVCHDVFSKGLKKMWPEYFREYTRLCIRKKIVPGMATLYPLESLFGTRFVIMLSVRNNWQENLRADYFHAALKELVILISREKLRSIAIPNFPSLPAGYLEKSIEKLLENKPDSCLKNIYVF